jgi:hypothetical protein
MRHQTVAIDWQLRLHRPLAFMSRLVVHAPPDHQQRTASVMGAEVLYPFGHAS